MRRKTISTTHMKDVKDWEFTIIKKEEENYYLSIKKINKIDQAFAVDRFETKTVIIDDGYYIIEYTPLNENYNGRVYLDRNLNEIEYYFDISLGNGVVDNIPYYDDLYVDILYFPNQYGLIELINEKELDEALSDGKITNFQYDLAKNTCSKLIDEINNNSNFFINIDKKELLNKYL